MAAGDIRAGRAVVELAADNNPLSRGLKQADAQLKRWGKSVNKAGEGLAMLGATAMAGDVAKLTAAFGAAVEFGNVGADLEHMSQRTGIAVESLSLLKFAADQTGIGMEDLETGVKKMQKALYAGSPAFAKLGLSISALRNMSPDEALGAIGDKLGQIENPSKRAARAMEIFGRSGTSMLPFLSGGAEGIANLTQQAREAGLGWSGTDAKAALTFKNALGLMNAQFKQIVITIGSAVAPIFTDLLAKTTPVLRGVIDWIKENKGLAPSILQGAAAGVVFGAVITGLGFALVGLGMVVGAVGTVLGALATIIGGAWAIITSPILLATVVLGYLIIRAAAASDIFSGWGAMFSKIGQAFGTAWQGIADALQSGQVELAAKIAFAGLEVVWLQVLDSLRESWRKFEDDIVNSKSNFGKLVNFVAPALGAALAYNRSGESGGGSGLEEARQRLEDAKAELEGLAEEAAENKSKAANKIGGAARTSLGAEGLGVMAASAGSFNPFALEAMTGSFQEKTLDYLGQIAKNTEGDDESEEYA